MQVNLRMSKKASLPPGIEDFVNRKGKRTLWISLFVIVFSVGGLLIALSFKSPKTTLVTSKEIQGANLAGEVQWHKPEKVDEGRLDLKVELNSERTERDKDEGRNLTSRPNVPSLATYDFRKSEVKEAPVEEGDPYIHCLWRGQAFEERGLFEEALKEYRTYIQKRKDHLVINRVAFLLIKLNRLKEAKETLEEAMTSGPLHPGIYVNYGVVLAKLGDLEGAERTFKDALMLFPDHTDLLYNLAVLLELKGDRKGAKEVYEKLKTLGDPEANDALQRLGPIS